MRARWAWIAGVAALVGASTASIAYINHEDERPVRFCADVGAVDDVTGATPQEVVRQFIRLHHGDASGATFVSRSADGSQTDWDVLGTGIDVPFESIAVGREGATWKYLGACVHIVYSSS